MLNAMKALYYLSLFWLIGNCEDWDYGYPGAGNMKYAKDVDNPLWNPLLNKRDLKVVVAIPKMTYDNNPLDDVVDSFIQYRETVQSQTTFASVSVLYLLTASEVLKSDCIRTSTNASSIKSSRQKSKSGRTKYSNLFMDIYRCPKNWGHLGTLNTLFVLADYLPFFSTSKKSATASIYIKRNFFYAGELQYYAFKEWNLVYTIVVAKPDVQYYWIMALKKLQFRFASVIEVDQFLNQGDPFKFIITLTEKYARQALNMAISLAPFQTICPIGQNVTYAFSHRSPIGRVNLPPAHQFALMHHFFQPNQLSSAYTDAAYYFRQPYFPIEYSDLYAQRLHKDLRLEEAFFTISVFDQSGLGFVKKFNDFTKGSILNRVSSVKYDKSPDYDADYVILTNFDAQRPFEDSVSKRGIKTAHFLLEDTIGRFVSKYSKDWEAMKSFFNGYVKGILSNVQFIFWSEKLGELEEFNTGHTRYHFAWYPHTIIGTIVQSVETGIVEENWVDTIWKDTEKLVLSNLGDKNIRILIIVPEFFANPFFAADVMALLHPKLGLPAHMKKLFPNREITYTVAEYGHSTDPLYTYKGDCSIVQFNEEQLSTEFILESLQPNTTEKADAVVTELYRCISIPDIFDRFDKNVIKYAILLSETTPLWSSADLLPESYYNSFGLFDDIKVTLATPNSVFANMVEPKMASKPRDTDSPANQAASEKLMNAFKNNVLGIFGCPRYDLCALNNFINFFKETRL